MCTGRIRYQKLLFLRVIKSFPFLFFNIFQSSSAAVLAATTDRLGAHGFVQVSTLIKSSSAAVLAASTLKLAQTHIALTGLTREQVLQLMMTSIFSTSTFSPVFSCSSLYVLELDSECLLRFFILLILSNFWF